VRAHDLGLAVALSSLTAACGASSGRASAGGGGGGASPSSAHTTTDATTGTRAATSHGHGGGSAGGAGGGVGGAGQGGDATTAPSATGVGGAAGLGGAAGVGGAAQATTAPAATTSASTGAGNPFGGCLPTQQATTNGGGTCSDLNEAYTARGINVGYYPFKVLTPVPQYSGDFSGTQGTIFTSSGPWKGVVLQMIPAGSYVGLSSSGPWYNPASDCLASNSCGDPSVDACTDDSPPLRPSVGGFAWGYAYDGASHMQGWIPLDGAALEFAGFDAGHPCALGPAGVDFEVHSACNHDDELRRRPEHLRRREQVRRGGRRLRAHAVRRDERRPADAERVASHGGQPVGRARVHDDDAAEPERRVPRERLRP
jgi:hypothetical protein